MPHDGDILYGIIQAERNGDFEEELEYLHQLSSTKRRNTRQLQRQYYSRPIYHALKRLTVFPGLFGKEFRLGCFNRILWMKCPEEFASYLNHVYTVWTWIMTRQYSEHLDYETVRALQGRCPHLSRQDHAFVEEVARAGYILRRVPDKTIRDEMVNRILQTKDIIPSLTTFLENSKWLESGHRVLRQIAPPRRGTLRQVLQRIWTLPPNQTQETGEQHFVESHQYKEQPFWAAYLQMHCYVLRHYPQLIDLNPRKCDRRERLPPIDPPVTRAWYNLALLAQRLGFHSPQISDLLSQQLLSSSHSDYLGETQSSIDLARLHLTTDMPGKWDLKYRCGRTFDRVHRQLRPCIFLSQISANIETVPPLGNNITPLFVFIHTFETFFSGHEVMSLDIETSPGIDDEFALMLKRSNTQHAFLTAVGTENLVSADVRLAEMTEEIMENPNSSVAASTIRVVTQPGEPIILINQSASTPHLPIFEPDSDIDLLDRSEEAPRPRLDITSKQRVLRGKFEELNTLFVSLPVECTNEEHKQRLTRAVDAMRKIEIEHAKNMGTTRHLTSQEAARQVSAYEKCIGKVKAAREHAGCNNKDGDFSEDVENISPQMPGEHAPMFGAAIGAIEQVSRHTMIPGGSLTGILQQNEAPPQSRDEGDLFDLEEERVIPLHQDTSIGNYILGCLNNPEVFACLSKDDGEWTARLWHLEDDGSELISGYLRTQIGLCSWFCPVVDSDSVVLRLIDSGMVQNLIKPKSCLVRMILGHDTDNTLSIQKQGQIPYIWCDGRWSGTGTI